MKNILLLTGLCFLVGCGQSEIGLSRTIERLEDYCEESSESDRAEFIVRCISAANPHSDEEPEDWIMKCQRMAVQTYCPEKSVIRTQVCTREKDFSRGCSKWGWEDVSLKVIDK